MLRLPPYQRRRPFACATALLCLWHAAVAQAQIDAKQQAHFDREIRPILQKCISCHGFDQPKAGLDLTSPATAINAGAITPGDPSNSPVIERVTSDDTDLRMPPENPLSRVEVEALRSWIAAGAAWPSHWAYRPLRSPPIPVAMSPMASASGATSPAVHRHPIDHFIATELNRIGLSMASPADRRTLVRRLYYDLHGLPPTLDDVERFISDDHPDAYQRLVDELLASPRYGERMARRWMDLIHYAESHGHDQDRPREHAWPYRDYLIRRFNEDVPYQQFLREQIAGDVFNPNDPWSVIATGLLAAGPWDESSLRDIQEDSVDREIGRYLDRDDIITTVMSTFASTSVQCARCHAHKFDAITQDEYYGLQSVVAGIGKGNLKFDWSADLASKRQQLESDLHLLQGSREDALKLCQEPRRQQLARQWEAEHREAENRWQDLTPDTVQSGAGASIIIQPDGSAFVDGTRPEKDTYTILCQTDLAHVRALRLQVLSDDRLPQHGPGRADNGNLHLNEVRIFAIDPRNPEAEHRVKIERAQADFDQEGWTLAMAYDGNPNTAWGIFPQVGRSHVAVFCLEEVTSARAAEPIVLRIELDQIHGGSHLIGKFRWSISDSAEHERSPITTLDESIAELLRQPIELRSAEGQEQLTIYALKQITLRALAELPEPSLVYCGTSHFEPDGSFRPTPQPRPVHVLARGEVQRPLRPATVRGLSFVEGLDSDWSYLAGEDEGARRVALAEWIANDANGLVWRSIANRIWQYHFGQALVETPNDFGHAGANPTHPELLDWLAADLRRSGGSLKHLHRQIVMSEAYRQSSAHSANAATVDQNNLLLWRMNRVRLDAESFRDSLLQITGTLDDRMGGPSDRQFVETPGLHVTPVVDYENFNVLAGANHRRSVYRFIMRTVPDPFMNALDCPDASQLTPRRSESITAIQALATWNDKFVLYQCEVMADQIERQTTMTRDQITILFHRILSREPNANEVHKFEAYIGRYGLINAIRIVVNTNEFLFVD